VSWFAPLDLQDRLSPKEVLELSTGSGGALSPDDDVLQGVLDRAESEIRGVLAGRSLPETATGLLKEVGLDLAVEALYLRQRGMAAKIPEGWDSRIKRSRTLLDRMADGEIPIPGLPSATAVAHRMEVLDPVSRVDGAFGGFR
jgi:phage gp36-like protein